MFGKGVCGVFEGLDGEGGSSGFEIFGGVGGSGERGWGSKRFE